MTSFFENAETYPHGTSIRYSPGRCRCDPCCRAHTLARKRWMVTRARRGPQLVDAAPTFDLIRQLFEVGWTRKRIDERCGWEEGRTSKMLRLQKRVHVDTERVIADLWEDVRPRKGERFGSWPMAALREFVEARFEHLDDVPNEAIRRNLYRAELIRTDTAEDYCDALKIHPTAVWGTEWHERTGAMSA